MSNAHITAWRQYSAQSFRRAFASHYAGVLLIALALLLWVRLIHVPFVATFTSKGEKLDLSWRYCNAYFLKHHLRAGVDFVFPTTLLGYFFGESYDSALFWYSWVWQLALNGLLAFNVYRMCLRFPRAASQVGVMLCCAALLPEATDVSYTFLIVTASSVLLSADTRSRRLLVNIAALAVLSSVKMTFLIQSLPIVSVASYLHWKQKRLWFLSPLPLFLLFYLLIWIAMRQHLSDIPASLHNLLSITIGYNEAMGVEASPYRICLGFPAFVLLMAVILRAGRSFGVRGACGTALLTIMMFQMWKVGFVRNDGHALFFYIFVTVLSLLLPVYFESYYAPTRTNRYCLIVCMMLCMTGFTLVKHLYKNHAFFVDLVKNSVSGVEMVLMPSGIKASLQTAAIQSAGNWDLPGVRRIIQKQSVDVFGNENFVALVNDFNYQPRPTFQSYACYTPRLQALNSAYYRSRQAPAFVLGSLDTTDDHLPATEDGDTLLELLRRYHPLLEEKGFLLFAQNARAAPADTTSTPTQPSRISQQIIEVGRDTPLQKEAGFHLLSLDIKPTWLDKARSIALRPMPVYLVISTEDGSTRRYRIVPKMAENMFLLDPLLENTRDLLSLYNGEGLKRVRAFRVEVPGHQGWWKQRQVKAIILTCPSVPRLIPSDAVVNAMAHRPN